MRRLFCVLAVLCAGIVLCEEKLGASSAPKINVVVQTSSFSKTEFAPGSFATILGSNLSDVTIDGPELLGKAKQYPTYVSAFGKVYVMGRICHLLSISPDRIDFQVPYEIPVGIKVPVQTIKRSGGETMESNSLSIELQDAAPEIFGKDSCPNGVTLVGAICTLSVGGLGVMNPPLEDGALASNNSSHPTHSVSLKVGGVLAQAVSVTSISGQIRQQVSFKYPAVSGSGETTTAVLTVADMVAAASIDLPLGISISPASVTLVAGQTQQFKVVVTGTDVPPTLSVTGGGTITQSGLYTAPATTDVDSKISVAAVVKVGAAPVQQASASVVVLRAITIKSSIDSIWLAYAGGTGFKFQYSGIQGGDTLHYRYAGVEYPFVFPQDFDPQHTQRFGEIVNFNGNSPPSWLDFWVTGPDGAQSNTVHLRFTGNQARLVITSTEAFFLAMFDTSVVKFKLADGSSDGGFGGISGLDMSIDDVSGLLILSQSVPWDDPSDGIVAFIQSPILILGGYPLPAFVIGNNKAAVGIAAKGGFGCVAQPNGNNIAAFSLANITPKILSAPVGQQPWSAAMVQSSDELDCVTYNRGDASLTRVSIPDMTVKGSVPLQGFTPYSQIANVTVGGWPLVGFSSGSAVGVAVALSEFDNTLNSVDLNSMTVLRRVALSSPVVTAADELHGCVYVALADNSARLTRFVSVDVRTGEVTPLSATTSFLTVGLATDGISLYAAGWDTDPKDGNFKVMFRILPIQ